MATGYTSDLHDGKNVTFNDFIMKCTRAMGVAIMQRDESIDVPLVDEEQPSTYHRDALGMAIAELVLLRGLSLNEWARREQESRTKATKEVSASIKEAGEVRVRYESMLAQVQAWTPPTPEHQGIKDFMVEQLTSSIQFDCSVKYLTMPSVLSAEDYRARRIAQAEKALEYHRTEWQKDQDRAASRNKWVADLRASLQETVRS